MTDGRSWRVVLATVALLSMASAGGCGRALSLGTASTSASAARTTSPTAVASATKPAPVPTTQPASSAPTAWPCPGLTAPPPTADWLSYKDNKYAFTISYPKGFTFQKSGGADPRPGWLIEYRAVDTCFLGGYPPGQVEMGVYTMDADTLTAWVQKHSDSTCLIGKEYFWAVSNLRTVTVSARKAVAFDVDASGCPEGTGMIHDTAFLLGTGNVFRISWWSSDPNYVSTVQAIAERMLASVTG